MRNQVQWDQDIAADGAGRRGSHYQRFDLNHAQTQELFQQNYGKHEGSQESD